MSTASAHPKTTSFADDMEEGNHSGRSSGGGGGVAESQQPEPHTKDTIPFTDEEDPSSSDHRVDNNNNNKTATAPEVMVDEDNNDGDNNEDEERWDPAGDVEQASSSSPQAKTRRPLRRRLRRRQARTSWSVPEKHSASTAQQQLLLAWQRERESTIQGRRCAQQTLFMANAASSSHARLCRACQARDWRFLETLRMAAMENISLYSSVYLDPSPTQGFRLVRTLALTAIVMTIQTVIPIGISIQTLSKRDYDSDKQPWCPRAADTFAHFLASVLTAYYGVSIIQNCLAKLRGHVFLLLFCCLGGRRWYLLVFSTLSDMCSLIVASLAQYILIVEYGESTYFDLMFVSFAMQFVLTADTIVLTERQKKMAAARVQELAQDEYIGILQRPPSPSASLTTNTTVEEAREEQAAAPPPEDEPNQKAAQQHPILKQETIELIQWVRQADHLFIGFVGFLSLFLTGAVAVCI